MGIKKEEFYKILQILQKDKIEKCKKMLFASLKK